MYKANKNVQSIQRRLFLCVSLVGFGFRQTVFAVLDGLLGNFVDLCGLVRFVSLLVLFWLESISRFC